METTEIETKIASIISRTKRVQEDMLQLASQVFWAGFDQEAAEELGKSEGYLQALEDLLVFIKSNDVSAFDNSIIYANTIKSYFEDI